MYSFHGVGAESVESSLKTGQPPSQNHQNFPMEEKRGSAKKKKKKKLGGEEGKNVSGKFGNWWGLHHQEAGNPLMHLGQWEAL